MIESLEEAEFDAYTGSQQPLLTYVVAGGGFAGVETVAAMNDFLRESVVFYPHLKVDIIRVVLIHHLAEILPELGEELGNYARRKLAERKVEIILNTKVVGYSGPRCRTSRRFSNQAGDFCLDGWRYCKQAGA
jgi:NADH dehydrogenase